MNSRIERLRCFNPMTGKRDGGYCVWEGGGKCYKCEAADELERLTADSPQAVTDVLAERQRQREAEGWTDAHDDEHTDGSLATVAACYILNDKEYLNKLWPLSWSMGFWKPKGDRRNLVRAAALLVAEIERLDRAQS